MNSAGARAAEDAGVYIGRDDLNIPLANSAQCSSRYMAIEYGSSLKRRNAPDTDCVRADPLPDNLRKDGFDQAPELVFLAQK